MPQVEVLLFKKQLVKPKLEGFNTSNRSLGSFMKNHAIREYWISREGEDAPLMTVKV